MLILTGISALSSQFFPSSSTTSAAAANNLQLVNMQNYGPNGFGDSGKIFMQVSNNHYKDFTNNVQ